MSPERKWHPAKSTYLFPVRALSCHIRGGFVSRLRQAINDGRLPRLNDRAQIDAMLDTLMSSDWVVYSKPCLIHTKTVVSYLGRYTHRIALSDARLLNFSDGVVDLDYKDYRDGCNKVMRLEAEELLRRYLLHILPRGFMRVRHLGFLANRCRRERFKQIREAIDRAEAEPPASESKEHHTTLENPPCPHCRQGRLQMIGLIAPKRRDGG